MAHNVPARLTAAEGRRFGLTVGIAFIALALVLWWRDHDVPAIVGASLGGLFLLSALVIPGRLGPVQSGWMRLALAISKVTTPVLMAIVYFIVITPIGLMRRLLGKSPVVVRTAATRWEPRVEHSRSDLHRQF